MTNLRVFEDSAKKLFLEISSPRLTLGRALLVPAIVKPPEDLPEIDDDAVLDVRFNDDVLTVFYLLIGSRRSAELENNLRLLGSLSETDSINILNHIVDLFAYP